MIDGERKNGIEGKRNKGGKDEEWIMKEQEKHRGKERMEGHQWRKE